jgi:hypothetical protein
MVLTGIAMAEQPIALSGIVSSKDGTPLKGAVVTLKKASMSDTTDASGAYSITNVKGGTIFQQQGNSGNGYITISNGILTINTGYSTPAVRIELFDIEGTLQGSWNAESSTAEEYQFDLLRGQRAMTLMIVRISIGQRMLSFRYFPWTNCKRIVIPYSSRNNEKLASSGSAIDYLKVSAAGYFRDSTPVLSYKDVVNFSLNPLYGIFVVWLNSERNMTQVYGQVFDDTIYTLAAWRLIDTMGCCKLFQSRMPVCSRSCGVGHCVDGDICAYDPVLLSVGKVTMSGLADKTGETVFSMDPLDDYYDFRSGGITVAYPPCPEGTLITIAAGGTGNTDPFTINTRAISPLVILNDSIVLRDHQPCEIRWVAPTVKDISTISVILDLTAEGGTKARIECDCKDNGLLTIPAALIDKLKTFGMSGFPTIEICRRSIPDKDTNMKIQFIMGSTVTRDITIPGLLSCTSGEQCPSGVCGRDMKCE